MKSGTQNRSEMSQCCTICIANYNGQDVLGYCLDSVFSQQGSIPFEVIVHDDASTDGSLRLLYEHYPQVSVIESNTNVGFCVGNNRMAQRARGDYILLINNDAVLWPDALNTLFEHAENQTRKGILTLPQYDWKSHKLIDRGCLLDPFYNPVPNLDPHRNDVAMVIGACLWVPRSLWNEIGGFPEWMGSIAEDMYLCCLARLYGYPVEGNHLVTTYRRRFLSERNKTFVMLISCPAFLLSIVFPIHLIILTLEGAVLSLVTGNRNLLSKVYFQVPRSNWQNRKRIGQLRNQVQRNRSVGSSIFLSQFKWFPRKLKLLFQFGWPHVR